MAVDVPDVRHESCPGDRSESNRPAMTGFGRADVEPYSWSIDRGTVGSTMHLAFTVDTREEVHVFHAAALAAGAAGREAPAVHPEYHADYYGAFVDDPHGIDPEAVCHHPVPR